MPNVDLWFDVSASWFPQVAISGSTLRSHLSRVHAEDLDMEFQGIQGMSEEELKSEVMRGGRFVSYMYCISVILFTFKGPSKTCFIRAGESRFLKGLPYTLLTLVAGWWGIPWGPIYTIKCLAKNLSGGEDVTAHVTTGAYVAARIAHRKIYGGSQEASSR
jgi:hypothetical protein